MIKQFVSCEITDLRGETVKHFRLSDGSFSAVSYETPVHYLTDDGNWEETDNTLSFDGSRYIAKAGRVEKSFAVSAADEYLLSMSVGGCKVFG